IEQILFFSLVLFATFTVGQKIGSFTDEISPWMVVFIVFIMLVAMLVFVDIPEFMLKIGEIVLLIVMVVLVSFKNSTSQALIGFSLVDIVFLSMLSVSLLLMNI